MSLCIMRRLSCRSIFSLLLIVGNTVSAQYSYTPYLDARNQGMSRKESKLLKEIEKTFKTITIYSPDISHCHNVDSFGNYIREQTASFGDYTRKIEADNKFVIKTRYDFFQNTPYIPPSPETSSFIEFLSGNIDPLSGIYEVYSNDLNASVGPYGNIEITSRLLNVLNHNEITGIFAHETAHHKLKHIEIGNYTHKKRERSNNMIAMIAAGLSAAAAGYSAGVSGTSVDYNEINRQTELYLGAAKEGALRYKFYISRENELEADIAAMRFLQFNGIDPVNYINALEKIMNREYGLTDNTGIKTNSRNIYDTHPSLQFRITALYCILQAERSADIQSEAP